jgi:hypothetical protein
VGCASHCIGDDHAHPKTERQIASFLSEAALALANQEKEDISITTFANAGVMSANQGFVLRVGSPASREFQITITRAANMTKKVAKRGWSLEKFTKSVNAQAKRLNVRIGSAAQIKKGYDDGLSVRATVATFTAK